MALVYKKISVGGRIVKKCIEKEKEKESNLNSEGKILNIFVLFNFVNRYMSEEISYQIIIFDDP
jgi:hypothetical protein